MLIPSQPEPPGARDVAAEMAAFVSRQIEEHDAIAVDDLARAGFSPIEILEHWQPAITAAREHFAARQLAAEISVSRANAALRRQPRADARCDAGLRSPALSPRAAADAAFITGRPPEPAAAPWRIIVALKGRDGAFTFDMEPLAGFEGRPCAWSIADFVFRRRIPWITGNAAAYILQPGHPMDGRRRAIPVDAILYIDDDPGAPFCAPRGSVWLATPADMRILEPDSEGGEHD